MSLHELIYESGIEKEIIERNFSKQDLFLELNEKDHRFADNKDVSLSNAKLGELGQVLDVVMNPNVKQRNLLEEIYCKFLECDPGEIKKDTKKYAPYKSNVIKFCLNKLLKSKGVYSNVDLTIDRKSEDGVKTISVSESGKSSQIIHTGPDTTVRIPVCFHIGLQKGKDKFVLETVEDYGYFAISFRYKKGDEKAIDRFIKFFDELMKRNNFYKGGKITPQMEFLKLESLDWSDVFLKEEVKEQIMYNITDFYEKEEIYKKNGINAKCGLIWEGCPGTGKTLTAKILFNKLDNITCLWVTPDSVNSARDVKSIYEIARDLSPSLVFFEDADLYCVDRSYSRGNPVLGEIMNQLDGLVPLEGVVTIFTSNDPGVMEKALIDRPGRFDERIVFDPPNAEIAIKMMKKYLSIPKFNNEDLKDVAESSEEMRLTGSHIKRLCDLAVIYAIKDGSLDDNEIAIINKEHLNDAVGKIKDMKIKAGEEKVSYLSKKKESINTPPQFFIPESDEELTEDVIQTEDTIQEESKPKRSSLIRSIVG